MASATSSTHLPDRRELLQLVSGALLGFSLPLPALPETHGWTPSYFNAHQNETLMVLTEMLIPRTDTPGANDAKVHRYLDLFMKNGNFIDSQQFLDGLAWLDRYSHEQHGRLFVQCSAAQQSSLLTDMADGHSHVPDIGHAFFNQAKNMTSTIYFSTEEGYRELNKFGPPPTTVACAPSTV